MIYIKEVGFVRCACVRCPVDLNGAPRIAFSFRMIGDKRRETERDGLPNQDVVCRRRRRVGFCLSLSLFSFLLRAMMTKGGLLRNINS